MVSPAAGLTILKSTSNTGVSSTATRNITVTSNTSKYSSSTATKSSGTYAALVTSSGYQSSARTTSTFLSKSSGVGDYVRSLNSNAGKIDLNKPMFAPRTNYVTTSQSSGMSTMDMISAVNSSAMSALNSLSKSDSSDSSSKISSSVATSDDVSSAISNMKSAKDSVSLSGAMEEAETLMNTKSGELETLTKQLPDLEKASETAKTNMKDLKTAVSKQEEVRDKAQQDVNTTKNDLSTAKNTFMGAENKQTQAQLDYKNSCIGFTKAESQLSAAKANIDVETGSPVEPAYTNAQKAFDDAKLAKEKALESFEQAEDYTAETKKAVDEGETAYKKQYELFQAAESTLETEQGKLDKANEAVADAEGAIKTYDKKVDCQKQLTSDVAKIEKELKSQESTLEKYDAKDQSTLDKLESKTDEKSVKELEATQRRVDVRAVFQNPIEKHVTDNNGVIRYGTDSEGEPVYLQGSKEITEAQYNRLKPKVDED